MSEPNNKYYKQWLEYENKNKSKRQTQLNYDLDKYKLSRAIDKIKTEEEAKNIFRIGNKIDSSKNSNYQNYKNVYNGNTKYIVSNSFIITNPIIANNPVQVHVQVQSNNNIFKSRFF